MTDGCGCDGGPVPACGRRGVSDLQVLTDLAPGPCRPLTTRLADLVDHLQLLDGATAVTSGHGAALASRSPYAAPTTVGGALLTSGTVLRAAPGVVATALAVDPGPSVHLTQPAAASVDLFDPSGRRLHQARLGAPEDLRVLDSLGPPSPSAAGDDAPVRLVPPVASPPGCADQIDLVDSHLTDRRGARLRALMGHDGEHARPVEVAGLEQLLAGVAELGLRPTFVVTSGLQQSHTGRIEAIGRAGRTLRLRSGPAVLAVSTTAVHRMWISRATGPHGPTSAVELFDAEGTALVLITLVGHHPVAAHRAWEELLDRTA
ncbi:hypothetical protein [Litorihabitans aurantiacus]|uniref:Haemin-degrading HemS/ChuX domain-containing protein n=1 Tax=Litorihabitans aurantiacus TaxID=1930061 RepID=A0AA37XEX7_9MICO|nr:hypothetical protein [Litorihabitans aurantiacus]GMA31982.1 hypothetical protein GCM10025875_19740 [Litorihabitans aurantiacus]